MPKRSGAVSKKLNINADLQRHSAFNLLIKMIGDLIQPCLVPNAQPLTPAQLTSLQHALKQLQEILTSHYTLPATRTDWIPASYTIMIGLSDKALEEELAQQLKYFNYDCAMFKSVQEIVNAYSMGMALKWGPLFLDLALLPTSGYRDLKSISNNLPTTVYCSRGFCCHTPVWCQSGWSRFLRSTT